MITKYSNKLKSCKLQAGGGFTLIEVMLSIGIIALLAGISIPSANLFLSRNEVGVESVKIADSLRRARGQAMAGQEDSAWGVHFTATQYTVFKGASYSSSDPLNDYSDMPGVLTLGAITINGGGSNIIFNRIKGDTSTYGTTTVQNDAGDSKTIVVNQEGTINIQ